MADNEAIDTTVRCYDSGVIFRMLAGDGFKIVRVTTEALEDRDGGPKAHSNYTEMLEHHRYTIEGVARRKLRAKDLEDDESILVDTADLQG